MCYDNAFHLLKPRRRRLGAGICRAMFQRHCTPRFPDHLHEATIHIIRCVLHSLGEEQSYYRGVCFVVVAALSFHFLGCAILLRRDIFVMLLCTKNMVSSQVSVFYKTTYPTGINTRMNTGANAPTISHQVEERKQDTANEWIDNHAKVKRTLQH